MSWISQQRAGQLSLFATGSLVTRRQHHVNRGDYYRTYLGTVQWQRRREQALERDRFRCRNCGSEARLVVHHQSYEHLGDEWPEDLKVLCWDCHQWEHERRRVA
jgi:5-methylcytosine-specific restriction endonuclease McrA